MFSVAAAHEEIRRRCVSHEGTDAVALAVAMMDAGVVRTHGPEHHYLTAACLCAAWCNALGEDKAAHLERLLARCAKIPPAVCGYYGVCGDSIAAGACASEMLGAGHLSGASWQQVNELTGRAQSAIAASCTRGPRCCKRTTFAVLAAASVWLRDTLGVPVAARGGLECPFYARNSECLGRDCVFFPAKRSQEVRHG